MKILLTYFVLVLLVLPSSAQSLQVEEKYNSDTYEFQELRINLSPADILISSGNQAIFSEKLAGKKVFIASSAENFFFIANYQFSNQKTDYPVDVRVFGKNGSLVFPYKFIAPFDLPHPLIKVNDNGVLALFDPLSFKVKLISEESFNEVELEKDVPFEMEKSSYMEMNEDLLYILTSQSALDITENAGNVKLYKVNLFDLTLDKKEFDYNTPTLLKIVGGNLFISGVKFENFKPVGKTIKFDLQLNQLASNDKIIENVIKHENRFYAKYFNSIFELQNDLSVSKEYRFNEGERISAILNNDKNIVVATSFSGKSILYFFSPDLSVDFNTTLDNFGVSKIENLSILGNHIIVHYDSKSVKIKINEN